VEIKRTMTKKNMKEQRTSQQNKALYKMFSELADELTAQGKDMRVILKPDVDIPWTQNRIKEHIWRPLQKAMFGTQSTTELTTDQVDKVFQVIQKHLGESHGVEINFPSVESIMLKQLENEEVGI
jgi:transcriptional regulator NrdR family protein